MDPVPLVIVEGFLSSAGALVWGNFEHHCNYACQLNGARDRKTIFASVGSVSSLHDRACELFYLLVGGTVDYGLAHSNENRHGRFGRTHDIGLYPEWSVAHPLHFLGHSMGGPTIVKLQRLIETGFFGQHYHPDMILSVSTVSSPFRGTQIVYAMGTDIRNAPEVRPFSPGYLLASGVHVLGYLGPLLPSLLDLHAEARGLSFRDASVWSLMRQLWRSDWATSRDAMPYDATFEAADEREAAHEGAVNPKTYYRSYCATLGGGPGEESYNAGFVSSMLQKIATWPLYWSSLVIASFQFSTLRPIRAFMETIHSAKHACNQTDTSLMEDGVIDVDGCGSYLSTALRVSDGVVPLFSQWHPYECKHTRCVHFSHAHNVLDTSEKARYEDPPEPGIWHVHHLNDAHHLSIVPFWRGTVNQEAFWRDFGHWLLAVDVGIMHRTDCRRVSVAS